MQLSFHPYQYLKEMTKHTRILVDELVSIYTYHPRLCEGLSKGCVHRNQSSMGVLSMIIPPCLCKPWLSSCVLIYPWLFTCWTSEIHFTRLSLIPRYAWDLSESCGSCYLEHARQLVLHPPLLQLSRLGSWWLVALIQVTALPRWLGGWGGGEEMGGMSFSLFLFFYFTTVSVHTSPQLLHFTE